MKVYEFVYNSCIHESDARTVSIHETKEGAEKALYIHKEQERKGFKELYQDNPPGGFVFGSMEYWGIRETEIQK